MSPLMSGGCVGHGCGCWTSRSCVINWACGGICSTVISGCSIYGSSCCLCLWCCTLYGCVCNCVHMGCDLAVWGHSCVLHSWCNCFHCLGCSLARCSCVCCSWGYCCGRCLAIRFADICSCLGCHMRGWCCCYPALVCCLRSSCMVYGACDVRLNCSALMGWWMVIRKWQSRSDGMVEGRGLWRQLDTQGHFSTAGRKCCKEMKSQ